MRNPVREKWIKSWNVEYDYGFVQIEKIDRDKSLHNQARMGQPLIPEVVTRYIEAKRGGAEFPPITVYPSRRAGEFVIIDGNHRMQAAEMIGEDAIEAYIVNVSDVYLIEMMTRSANIQMGQPPSLEDIREHAKIVVTRLGVSSKEAAKRFGISVSTLNTALRIDEVDLVLTSLNLIPKDLVPTIRDTLNQIKDNHLLLGGVFHLAVSAGLTSQDVKEVIQNIKNGHNEKEQLALLENYTKERGMKTRIKGLSPRRKESGRVWDALTRVLKLRKSSVVEYGITSVTDLIKFQDRAQQAITILNELLKDVTDVFP